jgi:hypothetical protein
MTMTTSQTIDGSQTFTIRLADEFKVHSSNVFATLIAIK